MTSRKHNAGKQKATRERVGRHPAFGALKGTVHISPGVDLTEPAEPEWEKIWLEANEWIDYSAPCSESRRKK